MNKPRAKMPPSQRAKQFAPFDAVVGLRKALYEKERIRVPRKLLSDDMIDEINDTLKILKPHDMVTLIHYDNVEQKYIQTSGEIKKINPKAHTITLANQEIQFENIYKISKPL